MDLSERKSTRLSGYDYSKPGMYFVTMVTQGRDFRFWNVGATPCGCPINSNRLHIRSCGRINDSGHMIQKWWEQIPDKFSNISIDEYIIMPNHFHGIIVINSNDSRGQPHGAAPTVIGDVINWFKTKTTNDYIRCVRLGIYPEFDRRLWQRNYYDHIIRDDEDLNRIKQYIIDNPANWEIDELNQ